MRYLKDAGLGLLLEVKKGIHRLYQLITPIQPGIKFLSIEPLHEEVDLNLNDFVDMGHRVKDLIDWVIIGGESGHDTGAYRYRPCNLKWIEKIVNDCKEAGIPVFVKQLGTYLSKELKLSDRHGGDIDEFPEHLKIREFPI